MQRGKTFEHLVFAELDRLNVCCVPTAGTAAESVDRVDCFVRASWTDQWIGIQLTLRTGFHEKIRRFVEACLRKQDRGPRIYAETFAAYGRDLREVAKRVAWTLRDVVNDFRNYGPNNMVGLHIRTGRMRRSTAGLHKFWLEDAVEPEWLNGLIASIQAEQARIAEAAIVLVASTVETAVATVARAARVIARRPSPVRPRSHPRDTIHFLARSHSLAPALGIHAVRRRMMPRRLP